MQNWDFFLTSTGSKPGLPGSPFRLPGLWIHQLQKQSFPPNWVQAYPRPTYLDLTESITNQVEGGVSTLSVKISRLGPHWVEIIVVSLVHPIPVIHWLQVLSVPPASGKALFHQRLQDRLHHVVIFGRDGNISRLSFECRWNESNKDDRSSMKTREEKKKQCCKTQTNYAANVSR